MPRMNVILRKEDLDPSFLHDKVAVVIDVLFATSTIVTALHQGALDVMPMISQQQALEAVRGVPEGSCVLAGESHLKLIPGFSSFAPLTLSEQPLEGSRLVLCTTNGTVALRMADSALHVYAAALLNGPAMVQQLLTHTDLSLVFVCSGSAGKANLEDIFVAGYFVDQLERARPGYWQLTDTSSIAQSVYRQHANDPQQCLLQSQLGCRLKSADLENEVIYAAQIGLTNVVPKFDGQYLRAVSTNDQATKQTRMIGEPQ